MAVERVLELKIIPVCPKSPFTITDQVSQLGSTAWLDTKPGIGTASEIGGGQFSQSFIVVKI